MKKATVSRKYNVEMLFDPEFNKYLVIDIDNNDILGEFDTKEERAAWTRENTYRKGAWSYTLTGNQRICYISPVHDDLP